METAHPIFQAAMIGIDVLEVKGPRTDALSRPGMHYLMNDAIAAGEGRVHAGTVRTEHCFLVDEGR